MRQARRLARRTARLDRVDRIVTSPLIRARTTAEIAFPERELEVDRRLMELDFGAFEGHTIDENLATSAWTRWVADPFERAAPNGESYRDLRERVVEWYREVPDDAGHVVAVTHSGTIQMLLSHLLGIERPRWRKRIYLRHSSLTRVVTQAGETVIERVNDTRHLDENGDDPFWE